MDFATLDMWPTLLFGGIDGTMCHAVCAVADPSQTFANEIRLRHNIASLMIRCLVGIILTNPAIGIKTMQT